MIGVTDSTKRATPTGPASETTPGDPGAPEAASTPARPETAAGPEPGRPGMTALASALRSVTSARPIVPAAGKPLGEGALAWLCVWAGLLGVIGLAIGIRGLVVLIAGHPAAWFKPTLILVGLGGIALTSCAFLTVRRRPLPWMFLAAATAVLIAAVVLSAQV